MVCCSQQIQKAGLNMDADLIRAAREAFLIQADCLRTAFDAVDEEQFEKAVGLLAKAERIAACACGHSGIACRHFAHLMCCINLPARFIPPSEALHGAMGFVKSGDVMLLASRGGQTQELLPVLEYCKVKGVHVITVTENRNSPLALGADAVLLMRVTRETDLYNCQGTTSHTVQNALFDAIQAALIIKTGFQNEAFAQNHPGGAVGERLKNLR